MLSFLFVKKTIGADQVAFQTQRKSREFRTRHAEKVGRKDGGLGDGLALTRHVDQVGVREAGIATGMLFGNRWTELA